jgi:GAF domain-containing protein
MTYSTTETQRLDALASYQILDTPAEGEFDQITRLAATICEAPLAAMSLIDRDRQWFKSRVGFDLTETPLSSSFCAHAIKRPDEVMVVGDATTDDRFRRNPLVIAQPHLRFYAGAPIVTPSGVAIGAICAIDLQPREISPLQRDSLHWLACWAVTFLEHRRIGGAYDSAQKHVRHLQTLLPVCPRCRTVRRNDEYYDELDDYLLAMEGRMEAISCHRCDASRPPLDPSNRLLP